MKNLVLVLLFIVPAIALGQELSLDTKSAKVTFVFESENLEGTVGGVEANIKFNPSNLGNSTIEGSAKVSTLSTGNNRRDTHLKSDDFFNAEKYPKMTFSSSSLKSSDGKYTSEGTLTIAGVSKKVLFNIELTDTAMILKTKINADDFNVSPKKREKSEVSVKVSIPLAD